MDKLETYFAVLWDTLDFLAEHPFAPNEQVIVGMKDLIERDPEGAARRASGTPQYDFGRDNPRLVAAVYGGGGEPPKPHIPPQPGPSPDSFALAAPAALVDCS